MVSTQFKLMSQVDDHRCCIIEIFRHLIPHFIAAPNTSPGDFGVTVLSSTTLELSWTPPSTEDRNGVIREYRVNITEVETARLLTYSTAMSSIRLQSLHPFYTYRCSVSAFTVATGPFSDISEVMMPQDGKR